MATTNFAPLLTVGDEYDLSPFSGRNMVIHAQRNNTGYTYTFSIDILTGFDQDRYYGLIVPSGHGEIPQSNPNQLFKITADAKLVPLNYSDGLAAQISYLTGDDAGTPDINVHWGSVAQLTVISSTANEGTEALLRIYRDGDTSGAVDINIGFIPGTADLDDVQSIPPSVTMQSGFSFVDVPITIKTDLDYEGDQSFLLSAQIANAPNGEEWTGSNYRQLVIVDTTPEFPVDVPGCMDVTANNYNDEATIDNGSCTYDPVVVPGCTDPLANNYDPLATSNNGSCTYDPVVVYGCTDPSASNYNPLATDNDNSCVYPPPVVDCLVVGDLLEVEHWFKVWFIEPVDGEQLHDQDLIQYKWSGDWVTDPRIDLFDYSEKNRVAMFKFTNTMSSSDSDVDVDYEVTAWAKDLRFITLDVTDEDSANVSFSMPCVIAGNTPSFSVGDITVTEPSSGTLKASVYITASEAVTGGSITIDYCSSDITATSSSASVDGDRDYEPACGTVTFEVGESSKQIDVTINTDNLYEPSETLKMTISNVSRGSISDSVGTIEIQEWIVPTVSVTLASQGATKELFVGRDTSGSTDAVEVTVNGNVESRRFLMEQVLKDYDIAICDEPVETGHGNDGCSDNSNPLSHYKGVAGATSNLTVNYINSIQPLLDSGTQEISILVMNDSSDAISHDNSVWDNEWAWLGALGIPVTLTFIRVIGQTHIDNGTGNYELARIWFEEIVAAAPGNVTAYFKSYSSYTTGAASDLNDILSSTVNNDYAATCNARPDDVIIVTAPDEDSALSLAQGAITCP